MHFEYVFQEWDIMREPSVIKETRLDKNMYPKRDDGHLLQEERLRRHMSIDDMASKLGVSVSDLQAYETNQQIIPRSVWNLLTS